MSVVCEESCMAKVPVVIEVLGYQHLRRGCGGEGLALVRCAETLLSEGKVPTRTARLSRVLEFYRAPPGLRPAFSRGRAGFEKRHLGSAFHGKAGDTRGGRRPAGLAGC